MQFINDSRTIKCRNSKEVWQNLKSITILFVILLVVETRQAKLWTFRSFSVVADGKYFIIIFLSLSSFFASLKFWLSTVKLTNNWPVIIINKKTNFETWRSFSAPNGKSRSLMKCYLILWSCHGKSRSFLDFDLI